MKMKLIWLGISVMIFGTGCMHRPMTTANNAADEPTVSLRQEIIIQKAVQAIREKYSDVETPVLIGATEHFSSDLNSNGFVLKFSVHAKSDVIESPVHGEPARRVRRDVITVVMDYSGRIASVARGDRTEFSFKLPPATFRVGRRNARGSIELADSIPWAIGDKYGWDVFVPANETPVVLKEIFRLPAPARFIDVGDVGAPVSAQTPEIRQQEFVTETKIDAAYDSVFRRTYGILSDDPKGGYRIQVFMNGEPVGDRTFRLE